MSKTKPEIAKTLLEWRNRLTHVILPGAITAEIGADGLAEALKERWLIPDVEDSGFLRITGDRNVVEEMHKVADMKPGEYAPAPIPVSEGRDAALGHMLRRRNPIQEIAAPMTGGSSPGLSAIGQPQQPAAPQPGQPNVYGIGTPVTVARQGVSATGVIEKLHPDGRYQVGFAADQKKPSGDNIYGKDEVSAVPSSPQRPGVNATSNPIR